MKGKIVIDFEQKADGNCSWKFKQEGEEELEYDDLIYLLENVIRDVMEEDDED